MLVEIYNGTMTTGSPPIASGESKYGGHGTAAITKFGGSVVTFHGGTTGWSECTASVRPSASLTPTSNIVCRVGWTNLDHTLSGFTIPCSLQLRASASAPHHGHDVECGVSECASRRKYLSKIQQRIDDFIPGDHGDCLSHHPCVSISPISRRWRIAF